MASEQKGCQQGFFGAKDHHLINRLLIEDCKARHKNNRLTVSQLHTTGNAIESNSMNGSEATGIALAVLKIGGTHAMRLAVTVVGAEVVKDQLCIVYEWEELGGNSIGIRQQLWSVWTESASCSHVIKANAVFQ